MDQLSKIPKAAECTKTDPNHGKDKKHCADIVVHHAETFPTFCVGHDVEDARAAQFTQHVCYIVRTAPIEKEQEKERCTRAY